MHATVISGKVTDAKGNAVGFVTVAQQNSTNATSANADGEYELDVPEGTWQIECSLMGYKTKVKTVTAGSQAVTLNFQLEEQHYDIGEVVITNGEDPAYEKMRQVIAHRKEHADMIKTLETDIYLKGILKLRDVPKSIMGFKINDSMKKEMGVDSNGKGIIYLLEELSHYQYKAPNKEFNKVVSVRQSGDPQGLGFASMPPVTNIYDNNIKIIDGLNARGFISPANSNAFLYYKYKFIGSYMEDGKMVSKIQVMPRRKYEPLFSGYVYVVENDWVFQSVDLTLTHESQMTMLDTLQLKQTYKNVDSDMWIIQSQVLYPALKIMGFDITGNFITVYQNQKINGPVNDSVFSNKIIAAYDSAAQDHKPEYWDSIRPIPLETTEAENYHKSDSAYVANKQKADSLKGKLHYNLSAGSFLLSGASVSVNKNTWSLNSIIGMVAYNTVEGLNVKPTIYWQHRFRKGQSFAASLVNRYGFSNHLYSPLLKLYFNTADSNEYWNAWRFGLNVGKAVYQLNNDNPVSNIMNDAYTLFGGRNYMKLYSADVAKMMVSRSWGNGLFASLNLSYENREALFNTTDYTFKASNKENITPNQPAELPLFEDHKAVSVNAMIRYQPGWKYIQYPKYKMPVSSNAPVFTLSYTKGVPDILDSKTDFDKWSFTIEHAVRMRLLGALNYKLQAGGFLNDKYVGIPDMMHIYGNRTFLANPYLNSFQLAPYYKYSNTADLYLRGHLEWHLNGWLTNKIPLFRRLNWFLVGGTNTLFINKNDYYSEVYVGLENIGWKLARFGRVDFVAGYESGKSKPVVGVRVGLGPILWALLGINNNDN